MKIRLKDLEKVNKVIVNDYTDYESNSCNTGGNYADYTCFTRVGWSQWAVTYSNSSSFYSCPYCGNWGDSCGCDEPQIISSLELLIELSSFRETEDEFIELAETA